MNARQLRKIGVPDYCIAEARRAIEKLAKISRQAARDAKVEIPKVLEDPKAFVEHEAFGELASALVEDAGLSHVPGEPIKYRIWGEEGIDAMSFDQMNNACRLPVS